jgi:hypothetical protein
MEDRGTGGDRLREEGLKMMFDRIVYEIFFTAETNKISLDLVRCSAATLSGIH